MTKEDKRKVLAELDELARGTSGVVRGTIEDCRRAVGEMPEEDGWIPVTEMLPEQTLPPHVVLVYHDLGCGMFVDRAWYNYDRHRWDSVLGTKLKVTHWMPLPEPPKEDAR